MPEPTFPCATNKKANLETPIFTWKRRTFIDFLSFFQLSITYQQYLGVVWPYNLEGSWNMLGGGWISKDFLISPLERKGGKGKQKEK